MAGWVWKRLGMCRSGWTESLCLSRLSNRLRRANLISIGFASRRAPFSTGVYSCGGARNNRSVPQWRAGGTLVARALTFFGAVSPDSVGLYTCGVDRFVSADWRQCEAARCVRLHVDEVAAGKSAKIAGSASGKLRIHGHLSQERYPNHLRRV